MDFISGDWKVQSGIIHHIHDNGSTVEAIQRGLRLMCKQCSNTVPTVVKIRAEAEGEHSMSADNTQNEETETPEVQEFPETNESPEAEDTQPCESESTEQVEVPKININPNVAALNITHTAPQGSTVRIPAFQFADAVSLFFDGKPEDSVRTILKGAGFIWQPRLLNPYNPGVTGAWIGPKDNLVGTPFEIK
jgi:hypothetical protein